MELIRISKASETFGGTIATIQKQMVACVVKGSRIVYAAFPFLFRDKE
jgi:hypothetical protein